MNIHPMFVHFPIALLTLYAVLELARLNIITRQPYYFNVKAILVILGAISAWAARITGQMAADLTTGNAPVPLILQMHKNFSLATALIFSLLALGYLILWLNRENVFITLKSKNVWQTLVKLARIISDTKLTWLIALAGLIIITITGGLGGRMVYGPDADPFLKPVLDKILGE